MRLLSPPVERSTTREEGATLCRLRRCSGSVSRGYSSRPSLGLKAPSPICGCSTGTLGSARLRGEELTGFHSREAGGRGSGERKLKLKMRFVRLQRAGGGGECGASERGGDDGPASPWDAVVALAQASQRVRAGLQQSSPGRETVVVVVVQERVQVVIERGVLAAKLVSGVLGVDAALGRSVKLS